MVSRTSRVSWFLATTPVNFPGKLNTQEHNSETEDDQEFTFSTKSTIHFPLRTVKEKNTFQIEWRDNQKNSVKKIS